MHVYKYYTIKYQNHCADDDDDNDNDDKRELYSALHFFTSTWREMKKISFFCRKNEQHIPPFFVQKRRYHFRRLFVLVILNLLKNMSKTFYNMQTNFRQGNVKRK